MLKLFGNIFGSIKGSDLINKIDDWGLTKEETIKYQLEWMRSLPTGFQLAQRFIGIAFSAVFLLMVLTTFIMLACGLSIEEEIAYITATMANPIMVIFSLFFGGGLVDSLRRKVPMIVEPKEVVKKKILSDEPDEVLEEELTKRDKRRLERAKRKEAKKSSE